MTQTLSATERRPYEAPKVFRVRVAGDELAVSGCKTNVSATGPTPGGCFKSNCKNVGS